MLEAVKLAAKCNYRQMLGKPGLGKAFSQCEMFFQPGVMTVVTGRFKVQGF